MDGLDVPRYGSQTEGSLLIGRVNEPPYSGLPSESHQLPVTAVVVAVVVACVVVVVSVVIDVVVWAAVVVVVKVVVVVVFEVHAASITSAIIITHITKILLKVFIILSILFNI